jgi:hypothetical protein
MRCDGNAKWITRKAKWFCFACDEGSIDLLSAAPDQQSTHTQWHFLADKLHS